MCGSSRSSAGQRTLGAEDVDRRVALAERELLRRRVDRLDDRLDGAVGGPNDPAVGANVRGLEREHGRGRLLAPVGLDELLQQLGGQERRVAGEDEEALRPASDGLAGRADGVAGSERALLHRDLHVAERVAALRRGDDDERRRAERSRRLEHPVDHAPAEDRVQVLRHGRAHARAEPTGHHHGCQ